MIGAPQRAGSDGHLAARVEMPVTRAPGSEMAISKLAINLIAVFKALGNPRRMEILEWLKDPRAHFREQVWGDLVDDGVCGLFIAEKLKVSQPTASEHLRVLVQANLITPKRIKQWTFYRRNEAVIGQVRKAIQRGL